MPFRWNPREHLSLAGYAAKWLLIGVPTGALIGSACALFLWSLDWATDTRWRLPWLLFLLPAAGAAIGALYAWLGKSVEGGNNLIVEQIHEPGGGVPSRMAPLVLIGTVVTHLFGGSAGREGTAIQMGGSIASTVGRWLRLRAADTRTLLMAGVAAGFGAVFGTPLTGAVFALEVLAIGRMEYDAIVPCLIASIVGDRACTAWGTHHTHYHFAAFSSMGLVSPTPALDWLLTLKVCVAAVAFGLASVVFAELAHGLHRIFRWTIPWPILRPVVGGLLVIALVYLLGTRDFLGLGVAAPPGHPHAVTILSSFKPGGAHPWSWWWKALFTAVTLSSGFKGGEVTPLFFIGAALGNSMAVLLGAPVDLFAGLGFIAVFAGATNTPLACTLMGVELFGSGHVVYMAVACFLAYLFSGHSGIYLSQRIGTPKLSTPSLPPDSSLRTARELQPRLTDLATQRLGLILSSAIDTDDTTPPFLPGDPEMAHRHKMTSKEIGQVRIYMAPREKRKANGIRAALFSKPIYQEIIDAAKKDGLLNAVAHHTHYGYSGNGKVQADITDIPNSSLTMCVELIAHRGELETFCRKHGDMLKGKVVVYKHMEHWDIHAHTLEETDATPEELLKEVEKEEA